MEGEAKRKWYHNFWIVIAMLVTLGPFAFPLLWKSPSFSTHLKWALTILFTALTVLMIWLSIETIKLVLKQFEEIRATLS